MIAIESGIPIPPQGRFLPTRGSIFEPKYPWMKLKVGESFVFPARSSVLHTQRLASTSVCHRHRITGRRYSVRTMEENGGMIVRVWRVA